MLELDCQDTLSEGSSIFSSLSSKLPKNCLETQKESPPHPEGHGGIYCGITGESPFDGSHGLESLRETSFKMVDFRGRALTVIRDKR